jgi:hypothetical protein
MMVMPLIAIAISTLLILLLCIGDPKRRRAAGLSAKSHGRTIRWMLTGAALLPGAFFGGSGDAAAFLMWFGGCAVMGWLIALAFRGGLRDRA